MSLVNDVLRDLENQPKTAFSNIDINAVPLAAKTNITRWVRSALLISIIVSLTLVVWKTFFVSVPGSESVPKSEHGAMPIAHVVPIAPAQAFEAQPAEMEKTVDALPIIQEAPVNQEAPVIPVEQLNPVTKAQSSKAKPSKVQQPEKEKIDRQAKVIPSAIGREEYQLAIKAYQKGRLTEALNWTEQALSHDVRDEYIVMKARLLMEQKDRAGFLRWVKMNRRIDHDNWMRLVAPGLQILGFYEESNRYYQRLIEDSPENIQWRLAAALNYSRMGDLEKTKAIYQSLINSPYSNTQQKAWLNSQVQKIDNQQS